MVTMKASTRLDSIVFQLTPTRTRCDLVIHAKMKAEKITSGLVNPFLAHSKTVEHQVAKGGYSIVLHPDNRIDAPWFTKGTVERFVRFVSTPEILERTHTLESEILQIQEALANQNIVTMKVDGGNEKPLGHSEGNQLLPYYNQEKAIVLFKPGRCSLEDNGSMMLEKNSKIQLIEVLERRKTVLLEEQGMAFASAVAAGFDINQMPHLMTFAENFGATRFMNACLRFMQLWTRKHEAGQWTDIEAAETTCTDDKQRPVPPASSGGMVDISTVSGDGITPVSGTTPETGQEYCGHSAPPNVFAVTQVHSLGPNHPTQDENARAFVETKGASDREEVISEAGSSPSTSGFEAANGREEDDEEWRAFQNILLKGSDRAADHDRQGDRERDLAQFDGPDSFVVSAKSNPVDDAGFNERNVAFVLSEFSSSVTIAESLPPDRAGIQEKYEAEELRFMPERTKESEQTGYDPALDYELHMCIENGAVQGKLSKDVKAKPISTVSANKNRVEARKAKASKTCSLDGTRTRAEKLRVFKAEIQKMKREKEEEEKKRLESLKLERQKRIAARTSCNQEDGKGKHLLRKHSAGTSSIQPRIPTRSRSTGGKGSLSDDSKSNMMNKRSHSSGFRRQSDKNMSAILNHDKFKSASLPELKVKAPKETSNETSEMEKGDDQAVMEKTIIAVECKNASTDHKTVAEEAKTDPAVDFVIVDGDENPHVRCQAADWKDSRQTSVSERGRSNLEVKAGGLYDDGHKKQPSGGFRRLLKLARKSHASGSGGDVPADDNCAANSTSTGDAFRHLTSLLPFRSKVKRSRSLR